MGANLGSLSKSRRRNNLNAEINITPFVDVMLVLLIIFMVTAPMLISGVSIDLPETSAQALAGQDEPLTIDINPKGDIFLQEHIIQPQDLVEKLTAITKEKKDTRIFIRGDKKADYGQIAKVLSLIHMAGFNKVALITSSEEETIKRK